MGYLKAVTEVGLKTTASGQRAFFPFGSLGRGRILPDEQSERAILRVIKLYYGLLFGLVLALGFSRADWRAHCGALAGLCAIYYVVIYMKVRTLPFTDERLGWGESYRQTARKMGRWWSWALCLTCAVFAGLAVLAAVTFGGEVSGTWPILAFAALMLFGAVSSGWLAWLATQEG